MQTPDDQAERFVSEYAEKIFYFCLRKCGGAVEAEDLASDITLNLLTALRTAQPASLSAYVWRVARNRYARWTDAKRRERESESVSGAGLDELDAAGGDTLEAEFVRAEDVRLLRRELAFIAGDYREIIVAHYIDDRKIDDIARSLSLPRGTVLSKLHRARQKLKRGMIMSREFGVMSYKPENINIVYNGEFASDGEPLTSLNRKLGKNIVLAAYRTPSTAEELAIELGVALPYMEDILDYFVRLTLMKKNGSKYETDFFIISADAQQRIFDDLESRAEALTAAVIEAVEYDASASDEQGIRWHEGHQPYEDMKWAMLMRTADQVYFNAIERDKPDYEMPSRSDFGHTLRPSGVSWDVIGYEEFPVHFDYFIGQHGGSDPDDRFHGWSQYKYFYKGIAKRTPEKLAMDEMLALLAAANGDTSGVRQSVLDALAGYGYLAVADGTYTPTLWVQRLDNLTPFDEAHQAERTRLFNAAADIGYEHYKKCRDIIRAEAPEFLKNEQYQIAIAINNSMNLRGAVLMEALRRGYITYEDNDTRLALGAYFLI
jgi:RNA polymerase sigma factor (sigma-70 family)